MNSFIKLFISIFICMAVGGISGYLTASEIPGWYMSLNKPGFNPPNWIFAPVWTTLHFDGHFFLDGMEEQRWRSCKKQSHGFFHYSVGVEFLLVHYLFQLPPIRLCYDRDCADVDIYSIFHHFFLSNFKSSFLLTDTLYLLGKFCEYPEFCRLEIKQLTVLTHSSEFSEHSKIYDYEIDRLQ